jgi:N-carbamoylputrescine amidase
MGIHANGDDAGGGQMILRVALLQMTAPGVDQEANRRKGDASCREAKARGADIALFPEMWNIGYTHYSGYRDDLREIGAESPAECHARAEWQAQAIDQSDSFFTHFQHLARELELAIALTYLERWPGAAPRNTVSIIDRRGNVVLTYAKVHTCDFSVEAACTPGEDFYVTQLDTAQGTLTIGAMICFDREFPESARILMLKGAELILVPNACEMEMNRLSQLRARAFENMVGIALANYAAPQHNGHSVAFDGIAFEADERSRDMCLLETGEEEGVYLANFDLDVLRKYREREVWGNAFRRPHRYEVLTSRQIRPSSRR